MTAHLAKLLSYSPHPFQQIQEFIILKRIAYSFPRVNIHRAAALEDSSPHNYAIANFLRNTFGFSQNLAITAAMKLPNLKNTEKPDQLIHFFKECGINDADIRQIVARRFQILASNLEKTVKPKVRFLQGLGIVRKDLGKVLAADSRILAQSLVQNLQPRVDFLRQILQSDHNIAKAATVSPSLLTVDLDRKLKPNVLQLQRAGINGKTLIYVVIHRPSLLSSSYWLAENMKTVQNLGLKEDCKMFSHALYVISSRSRDTLQRKLKYFRNFGLSEDEVLLLFKTLPYVITASEDKVRIRMEFIVETLKLPPAIVIQHPNLFTYSLEGRIKPRLRVFQLLKSKGLLKEKYSFLSLIKVGQRIFIDKFVKPYPELSTLYQTLSNASISKDL